MISGHRRDKHVKHRRGPGGCRVKHPGDAWLHRERRPRMGRAVAVSPGSPHGAAVALEGAV
jgi:hypothetical protein